MDDANYQSPPASHFEQVVEMNKRDTVLKQQAYDFMNQLDGWCTRPKAAILIDIVTKARPQIIVEIGVWGGKSLVPMAAALKANGEGMIYGIDPWNNIDSLENVTNESNLAYWGYVDHEAVMQQLISKIQHFDLENHIELIRSTSVDAAPIQDIEILHVDGNHSEKTSYFDVTKWVPLMKSGGWIIFDDMTWYENGVFTTARAVEWLNTNCIKFAEFRDDMSVWGIWIKP